MKRVIIESPYAGDVERNMRYLRACRLDCLRRGEAPFASHHAYTDILDDLAPDERELGIRAGFAWGEAAELRAIYVDLGISGGMERGIAEAKRLGQEIEVRRIPEWERET